MTTAINGHEAFELVKKSLVQYQDSSDKSHLYDCVVLDLNMPISGGIETCENIIKAYSKNIIKKDNDNESDSGANIINN